MPKNKCRAEFPDPDPVELELVSETKIEVGSGCAVPVVYDETEKQVVDVKRATAKLALQGCRKESVELLPVLRYHD